MRRRFAAIVGLAGMTCAGLIAALAIAPAALAWSPNNLPPGWTVSHEVSVGAAYCHDAYRIWNANRTDFSNAFCTDSPTYQQDFDAWIDARYIAPVTTTTQPGATTTVVITTTTTQPGATTTDAAAPAPAPAPPPTTTTTANAVTVVTTATPVEQALQAQIDALAAQLAALTDRVTRIEKAGDAAWLAFEQAVAGGATIPDAAEQARGTWLDAVYQLGAFKP